MSKLSLRIFINTSLSTVSDPQILKLNPNGTLSLNPKLNNPKKSRMNKLITKYSRLEFQHNRFRLLNGEIISKMPLRKNYSYIYVLRKFGIIRKELWYHMLYLFILEISRGYSMIPLNSRSFYLHGKENSSEFWTFPETSMTMHF